MQPSPCFSLFFLITENCHMQSVRPLKWPSEGNVALFPLDHTGTFTKLQTND